MDNNQAGAVAAYLVGKMLPKRGSKILLTLSSNLFDGEEQRASGFKQVIRGRFPHLGMVIVSEGQGLERSTYQLVENPRVGGSIPPPGTTFQGKINDLIFAH
jgi:LacI family transcriptional regulator